MNTPKYVSSEPLVFHLDASETTKGWDAIKAECPFLTDWGAKLLQKGLSGYARSVLLEKDYVCKDYRNIYSNFYTKKFLNRPDTCSRLHFFSAPDLKMEDIVFEAGRFQEDYLGYSVIQPLRDRCIGRTIINPRKVGLPIDRFFCLATSFKVSINGASYTVQGYPYISQSSEATVCAHSALWGVCRYLSERYSIYKELYPFDIIEMTGHSLGRKTPYRGMTYTDYSEILSAFGCYPVIIGPLTGQKGWRENKESFYNIYSYLESGFPVLVSYKGHVATIVGHTLKEDIDSNTEYGAGYINSFELLKEFLIVDDNFFPYQLLGHKNNPGSYGDAFRNTLHSLTIDSIATAVVPLPEKAFLQPDKARKLATKYLNKDGVSDKIFSTLQLLKISNDERLIFRIFLTSVNGFKKRKLDYSLDPEGIKDALSRFSLNLRLPHFIWVAEISPYSLYKTHRCIGEIVLDASSSFSECEPIYIRIGQSLYYSERVQEIKDASHHFPQYTHNLGER